VIRISPQKQSALAGMTEMRSSRVKLSGLRWERIYVTAMFFCFSVFLLGGESRAAVYPTRLGHPRGLPRAHSFSSMAPPKDLEGIPI